MSAYTLALLDTLMATALPAACVVLFPAAALRLHRTSGARGVWTASAALVGVALLAAAYLAQWSAEGDTVIRRATYLRDLPTILLAFALPAALETLAASLVVNALAPRWRRTLGIYMAAVVCAALAWVIALLILVMSFARGAGIA